MMWFRRVMLGLAIGVFTFSIAACNTVEGAGEGVAEDAEATEENIEDMAN